MDLPEGLRWLGFETVTHHVYRNALTFIARKPPNLVEFVPRGGTEST